MRNTQGTKVVTAMRETALVGLLQEPLEIVITRLWARPWVDRVRLALDMAAAACLFHDHRDAIMHPWSQ